MKGWRHYPHASRRPMPRAAGESHPMSECEQRGCEIGSTMRGVCLPTDRDAHRLDAAAGPNAGQRAAVEFAAARALVAALPVCYCGAVATHEVSDEYTTHRFCEPHAKAAETTPAGERLWVAVPLSYAAALLDFDAAGRK